MSVWEGEDWFLQGLQLSVYVTLISRKKQASNLHKMQKLYKSLSHFSDSSSPQMLLSFGVNEIKNNHNSYCYEEEL